MGHIHRLIDFTVSVYIVNNGKVLLVDHKILRKWLPIGGHIELDEDPDTALIREIEEEAGLKIEDFEIIGETLNITQAGCKFLYSPVGVAIYSINDIHKHTNLTYFAKSKTDLVKLAKFEHNRIKWFCQEEIEDPKYQIPADARYYAKKAIQEIS